MAELFRYAAFISYSSKDAVFARKLHRALESYGVPASLGKFDLIGGGKPNRIYPVFRDREELSAGDLGERIEASLAASRSLIVICSPHAAASPWVQKEIEHFVSLGRSEQIFAIIAEDAPLTDENGADATTLSFPPAFRGSALESKASLEPLAADARPGKDGFRIAVLKVIGGLIGVTPGQIIDRDKKRRAEQRLMYGAAAAAFLVVASLIGAVVDARTWRTRLSTFAEVAAQDRRPLDALAFALAGAPTPGSIISARSDRADGALTRVGATSIRYDFGRIFTYQMAPDGSAVATITRAGKGAYFNFTSSVARTDLGNADHVELSANGAAALITDPNDNAHIRTFGPNAVNVDLGPLSSFRLSEDGATLFTEGDDGEGFYYDLAKGGAKTSLGKIEEYDSDLAHGAALALMHPDGTSEFYDFTKGGQKTSLGKLSNVFNLFLAADDRKLLISDRNFGVSYIDLAHGSARIPLGRQNMWALSRNSKTYVTLSEKGEGAAYDLSNGGAKTSLGKFGGLGYLAISEDGARVLTTSDEGDASLFDLAHGAARTDLGKVERAFLSYNGASTVEWRADGHVFIRDLLHGGALIDLGPTDNIREITNQPDIGLFVQVFDGQAAYYDLLKGGVKTELGPLGNSLDVRMSGDDRVILVQTPEGDSMRLTPMTETKRTALGDLVSIQDARISSDGAVLIARDRDRDETAVLYDLAAPSPAAGKKGGALAASICTASGASVRPLPPRLRDQTGSATQGNKQIAAALKGRPWNPCDWRGFGAIFPDAKRGDGWFEGPGQWLRLMSVRYLGGKEWACEETTSSASDTTRERRKAMCALYAPPQPAPRS